MKTSELTGVTLDWSVATAETLNPYVDFVGKFRTYALPAVKVVDGVHSVNYSPSTNWAQAGKIIEREKIDLKFSNDGEAEATLWVQIFGVPNSITEYGETPLIAAMRCFVKAKLGNEINLPAELS